LAKISIFDAAGGLSLDNLNAGQLLMFTVMIPLRFAILRRDGNKRLHIIGTFIVLRIVFKHGSIFAGGAHAQVARQILRRLVRGLLHLPNMTIEFHNPVGGLAGSGSPQQYCGSKISENFCGIFVLLCYISAPLRN
jgi:hypothetical protein